MLDLWIHGLLGGSSGVFDMNQHQGGAKKMENSKHNRHGNEKLLFLT